METFLTAILSLIIGATLGRNSILKRLTLEEKIELTKRTNEVTEPFILIHFDIKKS